MLTPARLLKPLFLALSLLLFGCGPSGSSPLKDRPRSGGDQETGNPNIRFGMPGPAKTDPEHREAFLIERPQYVLSYNARKHTPNWVCWRLRQEDIGNAPRGPFEPDPALPKGFGKVATHVYDGSGFDRGHMCPAKDRSATPADSTAVFYLSNIVPQAPNCNQKAWERLEDYCRRLAKQGKVLHIACGPAGVGGEGKKGPAEEVGKGNLQVAVPAKLWKVIVVMPDVDAEPRKNTRVIAVIMPNKQSVDYDWGKYRVTTKRVEKLTGLHFFRDLPPEIASAWRNHLDEVDIPIEAHKGTHKKDRE